MPPYRFILLLAADTVIQSASQARASCRACGRPDGCISAIWSARSATGSRCRQQCDCFYFVADWHALTSDFADTEPADVATPTTTSPTGSAPGLDPEQSTFFVQSLVPEHAELYLLLSMVVPVPWLERVPTYKEQQENLKDKDLSSIGFLGYPLLQTADVAMYDAQFVPVGEDQVAHLELSREVVRRFNNFFGDVPRRAAAAADDVRRLPGPRRRQEDEQEPRQHDPPVGQRRGRHEEGHADVHGSQAGPRRHPGHRRRESRCSRTTTRSIRTPRRSTISKTRYRAGKVGDVEVKTKLAAALNAHLDPIRERRAAVLAQARPAQARSCSRARAAPASRRRRRWSGCGTR